MNSDDEEVNDYRLDRELANKRRRLVQPAAILGALFLTSSSSAVSRVACVRCGMMVLWARYGVGSLSRCLCHKVRHGGLVGEVLRAA